jgi:hypothetical protein
MVAPERRVTAAQRLHLVEELDVGIGLLAHAPQGPLVGAEAIAPVHERDLLGDAVEGQGPVERGVAAAHDEHAQPLERLALLHEVVDAAIFEAGQLGQSQLLGRKRPDAGGDDHGPAPVLVPELGA